MEDDTNQVANHLLRPTSNEDGEEWKAYWKAQGMPWRTEPEIDEGRQRYLAARLVIQPDVDRGSYPLKGVEPRLTRADVEWLLATHDSGGMRGPVGWHNKRQRGRVGLDLRGADLRSADLSGLPLAALRGGLGGPSGAMRIQGNGTRGRSIWSGRICAAPGWKGPSSAGPMRCWSGRACRASAPTPGTANYCAGVQASGDGRSLDSPLPLPQSAPSLSW